MKPIVKYIAIAVIICSALILCGCSKESMRKHIAGKLQIESIEKISGNIEDGFVISLRVKNATSYTFTLVDGVADVFLNGRQTATVALADMVTIPKRSGDGIKVDVPVKLTINNVLQAYVLMNAVRKGNYDGIEISVDAHVKAVGAVRSVSVDKMPLKTMMNKLGYTK